MSKLFVGSMILVGAVAATTAMLWPAKDRESFETVRLADQPIRSQPDDQKNVGNGEKKEKPKSVLIEHMKKETKGMRSLTDFK